MARVVVQHGTVEELHALDPFGRPVDGPEVWVCDLSDSAIVIGSRQSADLVDAERCRAAGLSVVRRRSGGGAVLLRPDAVVWIDVVLPRGVAPDDVRGSMVWIGERWAEVLGGAVPAATAARLTVHRGGMIETPWSELVCFAGVGPGEVLVGDRKFLGLSQRRTRHGIRVQGSLYRRPITGELPPLIAGPVPDEPPAEPHWELSLTPGGLAAELARRLPD